MTASAPVVTDPPVRDDGACANCGEHHRPRKPGRYHRDQAKADPFHSTECCKAWYGLEHGARSTGARG